MNNVDLKKLIKQQKPNFTLDQEFYLDDYIFDLDIKNIFDVPESTLDLNRFLSKFLLTMAMAAIGLKISFLNIFKYGFKPIFVALIGNIIQIIIVILFVTYFL